MPIAAPIAAGATVRCIAICRPESIGPTPRPISPMYSRLSQSGVEASKVANPSAPSASEAEAGEDRRAVLAALDDHRAPRR